LHNTEKLKKLDDIFTWILEKSKKLDKDIEAKQKVKNKIDTCIEKKCETKINLFKDSKTHSVFNIKPENYINFTNATFDSNLQNNEKPFTKHKYLEEEFGNIIEYISSNLKNDIIPSIEHPFHGLEEEESKDLKKAEKNYKEKYHKTKKFHFYFKVAKILKEKYDTFENDLGSKECLQEKAIKTCEENKDTETLDNIKKIYENLSSLLEKSIDLLIKIPTNFYNEDSNLHLILQITDKCLKQSEYGADKFLDKLSSHFSDHTSISNKIFSEICIYFKEKAHANTNDFTSAKTSLEYVKKAQKALSKIKVKNEREPTINLLKDKTVEEITESLQKLENEFKSLINLDTNT
jgi:hypothetical protein